MKNFLFLLLILFASTLKGQSKRYFVGDTVRCGIVFYTLDSARTQHILICALADQDVHLRWFNGKYVTTRANQDIIFSKANADRVIAVQGQSAYAATIARSAANQPINCDTTGWYLPSKTDLKIMYDSLAVKRKIKFAKEGYWSSVEQTQTDSTSTRQVRKAWLVDFHNGRQILNDKSNKYHVRAVRDFFNFF